MRTPSRLARRLFTVGGLGLAVMACGGAPMVPTTTYAHGSGQREHPAWALLARGQRVVITATPGGDCGLMEAATLHELARGAAPTEPDAAGSAPVAGAAPRVLEIVSSRVKPGEAGYVALEVRDGSGRVSWLRVPQGARLDCILTVTPEVEASLALVGTRQVFTPWKEGCRQLHAAGAAAASLLLESELSYPMDVRGLRAGPATARAYGAAEGGNVPWLELGNGAVTVRADVVSTCFTTAGEQPVAGPASVTTLLHLAADRCDPGPSGPDHLVCRTTLGVWEGLSDDSGIDLSLVRRTLGPVHFLGSHPVAGQSFAKAVVAVTKGQALDPRGSALYAALDAAVAQAVAKESGGLVRMAAPDGSDATYFVHVEVSALKIGELERGEVTETSQYKIGERTEDNPEHPVAQARVATAEAALQQARADYAQALQNFETAKQAAIAACHDAADTLEDDTAKSNAHTACDVGGALSGLVQPSDDGVESAQAELDAGRMKLAQTPPTLTVDVMADWQYTKVTYSRSTSASLRIELRPKDRAEPAVLSLPLEHTWSDHEVKADPAHNVAGHDPERAPLDDPEAVVPFIAAKASEALAVRLKAALGKAAIEQAMKAFLAAGRPLPPPGFEEVDAVAFEVAGARLGAAQLRSQATLAAGASTELPLQAARPVTGGCLLAVAIVKGDVPADLTLATASGSHADRRGASMALVELCPSDLGAVTALEPLVLTSQAGCSVKWAIFATTSAGLPGPSAAASFVPGGAPAPAPSGSEAPAAPAPAPSGSEAPAAPAKLTPAPAASPRRAGSPTAEELRAGRQHRRAR